MVTAVEIMDVLRSTGDFSKVRVTEFNFDSNSMTFEGKLHSGDVLRYVYSKDFRYASFFDGGYITESAGDITYMYSYNLFKKYKGSKDVGTLIDFSSYESLDDLYDDYNCGEIFSPDLVKFMCEYKVSAVSMIDGGVYYARLDNRDVKLFSDLLSDFVDTVVDTTSVSNILKFTETVSSINGFDVLDAKESDGTYSILATVRGITHVYSYLAESGSPLDVLISVADVKGNLDAVDGYTCSLDNFVKYKGSLKANKVYYHGDMERFYESCIENGCDEASLEYIKRILSKEEYLDVFNGVGIRDNSLYYVMLKKSL